MTGDPSSVGPEKRRRPLGLRAVVYTQGHTSAGWVRSRVDSTDRGADAIRETSIAMSNIQRQKYSISAQQQDDWCIFCKCFVQKNATAKRNHENSEKHKKNVEIKMRQIKKDAQRQQRDEENTKNALLSIEAKAAAAYQADLAAGPRPEDTHGPAPLSSEARARLQEEHAKKELESALETELKARAEAEYRSQQERGVWKFDDRSSYYWHAKSSHYFDPKSGMYFNTKTNAWLKTPPPEVPPPPNPAAAAVPEAPAVDPDKEEFPLGPFSSSNAKATAALVVPAPKSAKTDKEIAAAAAAASKIAGWSHAPAAAAAAKNPRLKGTTSLFNLGYGTNHPKFEAARAKTQGAAQRALEGAGGRQFVAQDAKKLGMVTKEEKKRKKGDADAAGGKKPKVSKEEAEALAKRAAARARVEARTMSAFGLQ